MEETRELLARNFKKMLRCLDLEDYSGYEILVDCHIKLMGLISTLEAASGANDEKAT